MAMTKTARTIIAKAIRAGRTQVLAIDDRKVRVAYTVVGDDGDYIVRPISDEGAAGPHGMSGQFIRRAWADKGWYRMNPAQFTSRGMAAL